MYHLVVVGSEVQWDQKWVPFPQSRFLEHTDERISAKFAKLGPPQIAAITAMPALFMSEGSADDVGRLGRITQVRLKGAEIGFTYEFHPGAPPISWATILKHAWDLDVSIAERTRTHWAIKDADLLAVLVSGGVKLGSGTSKPTRAELLKASKDLEHLGHSDFDRLLLELGIDGLEAGRSVGSLMARANALCKFALEHPDARTAEGADLWSEILRHAERLQTERPGLFPVVEVESVGQRPWTRPQPAAAASGEEIDVSPRAPSSPQPVAANKVFLVHGRNEGTKHEVARFLEKLGLDVTILHERPNRGRTLISKFREESADISFAVVLMTPDDIGGLTGAAMAPRARQNVVFELGFFIGKLGADKVCALVKGDVERPSDFDAVVYVSMNDGSWKVDLARELKDAGLAFDHSKVFS